ncbi:MAG: 3-phosphoshikimate 1-carboxyvinyltransferase [Endomicrobium sp.]|jgi:3-phosphoshikimate 1-carboxyvinyltransferase|nr:3-phosphoshikimate 1-carboxyvinyltransferase [Endomicrobium sp.]
MNIKLKRINSISGVIEVPSDKSITHRAVMLASIARGNSIVRNYLQSDDCNRTIEAFRQFGAKITIDKGTLFIEGAGLKFAKRKSSRYNIYAGNSGTTARLFPGILVGQDSEAIVTGDSSLSKRPMQRIIDPLSKMGAKFESAKGFLPLIVKGTSHLKAISYINTKSTGQVKSAVLFAGLYADGITTYSEPIKSRDHSERMLRTFGADVRVCGNIVNISPVEKLIAQDISVPGDISSAAFFIVAALIVTGSNLTIKNVGVNPTRDGLIEILKQMGADITLTNMREISHEPVCDIVVKYSKLKAVNIDASVVPRMIDEIPIFALVATQAEGITKISGAKELRIKESDRISAVVSQFRKLGAEIEALEDGFVISGFGGAHHFTGTVLDSFEDHRIAMTLTIASLIARGETVIKGSHCVNISFPGFYEVLKAICK